MSVFADVFDCDVDFVAFAPCNEYVFIMACNPLDLRVAEAGSNISGLKVAYDARDRLVRVHSTPPRKRELIEQRWG